MKKSFLVSLCFLSIQNSCVNAQGHGIVFEEENSITEKHPYLKGLKLSLLPLCDPKELSEIEEKDLKKYNFIVENEYAIDDSKEENKLATIGIYDCIGLMIPNANVMMHIHKKTNLESVQEIVSKHAKENIFLYSASIVPYIENVVECLIYYGINKESITLSLRPMTIEEPSFENFKFDKYTYSYDDTCENYTSTCMPQKVSFYVNENEKQVVKNCYLKYLQSRQGSLMKAGSFMTEMRGPLNISLKNGEYNLFKMNYELMRNTQETINEKRDSLSMSNIVQIIFK